MRLKLRPLPVKRALRWCRAVHRRLPTLQGGMWAVAVIRGEGAMVGCAIVGRPTARMAANDDRDSPLDGLQVLRVAVLEGDVSASGHKGACSMLYGACARAARAMGAIDLWTYISLMAAGWVEGEASGGGEWCRPSRSRGEAVESGGKRKWFAPWSAKLGALPNAQGRQGRMFDEL